MRIALSFVPLSIMMLPLHGLGLSSYIVFLGVLQVIRGLKLDAPFPSPAVFGRALSISWTPQSGDPSEFGIKLMCNSFAGFVLVSSIPLLKREISVKLPLSFNGQNSLTPVSCSLTALDSNSDILDEVPIEVDNFIKTTSPSNTSSQTMTGASGTKLASSSMSSNKSNSDTAAGPTKTSFSPINPTVASGATTMSSPDPKETSVSRNMTRGPNAPTQRPATTPGSTASSPQTSKPIGAIIGGVVGGLVGLGILAILVIVCLRRRHRSPPTPRPLPYDQNYVQPLDKSSQLAQLTDEREAVRRQRDQLQTEVERMHLHESVHDETSNSGVLERKIEALSQRIFELERQLYDQSPPNYSNLSSAS